MISIHALLAESDGFNPFKTFIILSFLSTLSLRRATVHYDNYNLHCTISIHALLAESDGGAPSSCFARIIFLSTLSLRRATRSKQPCSGFNIHFYPRSPCGERPNTARRIAAEYDFYPRSPCGERHIINGNRNLTQKFLSTLSLRRATVHYDNYNLHCVISIHALLAESDRFQAADISARRISIHALLAESDAAKI